MSYTKKTYLCFTCQILLNNSKYTGLAVSITYIFHTIPPSLVAPSKGRADSFIPILITNVNIDITYYAINISLYLHAYA